MTIKVFQGEREIAAGNKSLGEFNLEGIPPSPRGLPQIEVSFDIDANGILHVGAKDKATGKENKITIKANSGISEEEIQKMVKDAELNAAEDHKKLELVQARNQADAMVHSVRKSVTEHGDKLDAAEKEAIEAAIKQAEESLKSDDKATIDAATEKLMTASQKLGEKMYADSQAAAAAAAAATGAGAGRRATAPNRSRPTTMWWTPNSRKSRSEMAAGPDDRAAALSRRVGGDGNGPCLDAAPSFQGR